MSGFFRVFTYTPWDALKSSQLTEIKLLSLKDIFPSFPVVEEAFFEDIRSIIQNYNHYSSIESIKRIVGPTNEDYSIENWSFIWAFDDQRRMFQFLFQKEKEQYILVALAPPELAQLFREHRKEAILKIFTLLNKPDKMKFLMVLKPLGKSIAEDKRSAQINPKLVDQFKFFNELKNLPNLKGDWFPSFEIRCPYCNKSLKSMQDYKVGLGKLLCPHCGKFI